MADLQNLSEKLKSSLSQARTTKSTRIWLMVGLLAILFLLWWLKVIKTGFAIGIGILILAAIGIETFNYDLDLGKLWETGDIQASRVSHTKDGIKLMGSCALPTNGEKNDLDCKNFSTQVEAQAKYDTCATEISSYNDGVDTKKLISLDIYGLDGDKDGIVCESLPGNTHIPNIETDLQGGSGAPQKSPSPVSQKKTPSKSTTSTKTQTSTTSKTPVYSRTPVLNSDKPFPISEATIRTNPKVLPAQ